MLSVGACIWPSLERLFGPHLFDLMSLDCKISTAGLCPTTRPGLPPDPLGSTFSLIPYRLDTIYIYVFPPFVLLGPHLRYVVDQELHEAFTLIVPDIRPKPF